MMIYFEECWLNRSPYGCIIRKCILALVVNNHFLFGQTYHFIDPKVDPKLGPQRKTAGVRNLPKLDRSAKVAGKAGKQRQQGKAAGAFGEKAGVNFDDGGKVSATGITLKFI